MGLAALRDFNWAEVGFGSKREAAPSGLMSASAGCGHEAMCEKYQKPETK
jgi:hypothetical protein